MLAEANHQLEEKELFINVQVSGKEKDYYELKKRLEDKIGQLESTLSESTDLNVKQ